jgi:hypothetical protein
MKKYLAHPQIPIGVGTLLGIIGTILTVVATTLTTMLPGDQTQNTKLFAIIGTIITVVTIIGRVAQAVAAIITNQPNPEPPTEGISSNTLDKDPKDVDPALEHEAGNTFETDVDPENEKRDLHEIDDDIGR